MRRRRVTSRSSKRRELGRLGERRYRGPKRPNRRRVRRGSRRPSGLEKGRWRRTKERNKKNELRHQQRYPLRNRAESARGAGDGHLLATLEGSHHLPRYTGGRPSGERYHGAVAPFGE